MHVTIIYSALASSLDVSCKNNSLRRVGWVFQAEIVTCAQNRSFAKNKSCIQILDTTLNIYIYIHTYKKSEKLFYIFGFFIFDCPCLIPGPLKEIYSKVYNHYFV